MGQATSRELPHSSGTQTPLSPVEQRFVDEYLIDGNGTRAYLATHPHAGYGAARVAASRLVAKANIRAEIDAARYDQSIRTRVSADRVLRELGRVAFSDIVELSDENDQLRSLRQIPLEARRAISSVKVRRVRSVVTRNGKTRTTVTEQVIEYKLWSKLDALGKLVDHLGLSTTVTPLEAFLAALPADLAAALRKALSVSLPMTKRGKAIG